MPDSDEEQPARRPADREPVIPTRAEEDRDIGWGELPRDDRDDWYERERPPHHGT
ncbi:MAG TPA: hypothetical protein VHC49_11115 [Mycobacteriales bacterium]|nr:hypothetical protein [Mycobacteriales bacterium]